MNKIPMKKLTKKQKQQNQKNAERYLEIAAAFIERALKLLKQK